MCLNILAYSNQYDHTSYRQLWDSCVKMKKVNSLNNILVVATKIIVHCVFTIGKWHKVEDIGTFDIGLLKAYNTGWQLG